MPSKQQQGMRCNYNMLSATLWGLGSTRYIPTVDGYGGWDDFAAVESGDSYR